MVCHNCGSNVKDGNAFCTNCGASMNVVSAPNNTVVAPPPKKSNAGCMIGILIAVVVFLLIVAGIIVFALSLLKRSTSTNSQIINNQNTQNYQNYQNNQNNNNNNNNNYNSTYETITVKNVSIKYNKSSWNYVTSKSDANTKVINNGNYAVALRYSDATNYISTDSFAKTMRDKYKEEGYTIDKDISDKIMGGKTWKRIYYSKDNISYIQAFLSTGYELYSVTLAAPTSESTLAEVYFNSLLLTLTYDKTSEINGEKEAKKVLVGEWDWGISGYFVFEENGRLYLYKDSSKSMDNVIVGTYTADNKIATYGSGYADGQYVVFTISKMIMDGKEQKLVNDKIEYAFTKNSDGTYTIKNITTGNVNTAKKIK